MARALSQEGNFDDLLDPRLEGRIDRLELERMCSSSAAAVRHSAKRRPKMKQVNLTQLRILNVRLQSRTQRCKAIEITMNCFALCPRFLHAQIVRALEGDASLDDLNEGVKPGQSMMFSSGSENDAGGNYASNVNNFRKVAFENSEYSEYSGTSDYGADSGDAAAATRRQQHR